jgi:hypothetical protein
MAVEVIGMNNIEVYPKLGTSGYFQKSIIDLVDVLTGSEKWVSIDVWSNKTKHHLPFTGNKTCYSPK